MPGNGQRLLGLGGQGEQLVRHGKGVLHLRGADAVASDGEEAGVAAGCAHLGGHLGVVGAGVAPEAGDVDAGNTHGSVRNVKV